MASANANQPRWIAPLALFSFAAWYCWACGSALFGPSGRDLQHPAILTSAYCVVFLWPWGAILPLAVSHRSTLRWAYTLGCILCVLHVAIAFHLGHGWSHQAAFEHTERASGFGAGVFVNDFFVLLWIADVIWAWAAFEHYLKRSMRVNWLVIGFMGFIVFNAAVVFAHGAMRGINLVFLAVPWPIVWFTRALRSPRDREHR